MPATTRVTRTRLATMIMAAAFLAACGNSNRSSINGTYSPTGDFFFEKLTFKSGGKVEYILAPRGTPKETTYEVEGKNVKIIVAGDTMLFTIDDKGCLDGGRTFGKYCKT